MTAKTRTVEATLREERAVLYALEDLASDERQLKTFEADILNSHDESLSRLNLLMDITWNQQEDCFYQDLWLAMQQTGQLIQESLADDFDDLHEKRRRYEDRLDELYHERRRLYQQEEEKKRG